MIKSDATSLPAPTSELRGTQRTVLEFVHLLLLFPSRALWVVQFELFHNQTFLVAYANKTIIWHNVGQSNALTAIT